MKCFRRYILQAIKNNLSRNIFVFQFKQPIRIDWSFIRSRYPNNRFILVSSNELLQNFSKKNDFDNILETNDFSYKVISNLIQNYTRNNKNTEIKHVTNDEYCLTLVHELENQNKKLNLVHHYINKVKMKSLLQEQSISVPQFLHVRNKNENNDFNHILKFFNYFPLIGKPVSDANNRGVVKLETPEQLQSWLKQDLDKDREIEKFIDGTLYHCNSVILNDEIHVLTIGRYLNPCLDFNHGKPIGSIFISPNHILYKKISKFNEKVINTLGRIDRTVLHLECFVTEKEDIIFLEIAARAPGALLSEAASYVIGHNMEELNFHFQIEEQFIPTLKKIENSSAFWCWFPKPFGKTIAPMIFPKLNSEATWYQYVKPGEVINEQNCNGPAYGVVAWTNNNLKQFHDDFAQLKDYKIPIKELETIMQSKFQNT